ncbi:MAG: thiamine-phosphate kinase [Terracidiphilus sp.]
MLETMRVPSGLPVEKKISGERAILQRIRRRTEGIATPGLSLGIGDDCALLMPRPGEEVAITTDLSIASRHFSLECHSAEVVGWRTLARGLSDLAAMGARPLAAFLSLGLPRDLTRAPAQRPSWVDRFLDGLLDLAAAHNVPLAGGDLAESPLPVADIVLVGAVPRGRALLRSGARAGDLLYVTGSLGGSAAGLAALRQLARGKKGPPSIPAAFKALLAAHLAPQPRIAQGLRLQRRHLATAAIDLSDGLSTDLAHLCEESGVGAVVEAATLPLHAGATLQQALHGGEDYELLFTAPPTVRVPRVLAGVAVTRIGKMVRRRANASTTTLRTDHGLEPIEPHGWEHFS